MYADIEGARAAGGVRATIGYQAGGVSNTYQYGLKAPAMVRDGSVISIGNTEVLMADELAGSLAALLNVTAPLIKTVAVGRDDVSALVLQSPGFKSLAGAALSEASEL